jgi:hypothetical protein
MVFSFSTTEKRLALQGAYHLSFGGDECYFSVRSARISASW